MKPVRLRRSRTWYIRLGSIILLQGILPIFFWIALPPDLVWANVLHIPLFVDAANSYLFLFTATSYLLILGIYNLCVATRYLSASPVYKLQFLCGVLPIVYSQAALLYAYSIQTNWLMGFLFWYGLEFLVGALVLVLIGAGAWLVVRARKASQVT